MKEKGSVLAKKESTWEENAKALVAIGSLFLSPEFAALHLNEPTKYAVFMDSFNHLVLPHVASKVRQNRDCGYSSAW